jgi:uncharacterized protein YycO
LAGEALTAARPGDALFKRASGFWGRLAASFSDNSDGYGHVGIVAADAAGRLVVIHAGGDPATRNGRVQATPLADFLYGAKGAAIYRLRAGAENARAALDYAEAAVRRGAAFDAAFDLATEDSLYCTELVWRALAAALGEDPVPTKSARGGRVYVGLDDLQESPFLVEAWRFRPEAPADR